MPPGSKEPVATRREGGRLVFLVVAVALFMSSIDQTMVAAALPTLSRDLDAGVNWSGWTISVYSLGLILAMPLGGRLSDQFGRKRVFLVAIGTFSLASLCCGLAPNIYVLVACRVVQALGGGVFLPSSTGIVADEFPRNRDRMVGSFVSIFPIGAMVGPIIGAFVVSYWSWRVMFFINVPVGIALLIVGARTIQASPRQPGATLDSRGVALLGAALLATMYGFARLGDGEALLAPFVSVSVGSILIGLFLRHAARYSGAFVPIGLLRGRSYGVMNTLNFVFGSACLGLGALVPLYAQQRFHIDTLSSGTLLTARAFGIVLIAGVTVMLLRRIGYRLPMVVGLSIVTFGLVLASMTPRLLSPYGWLAVATAISGVGMGIFMPAANNATLHLDPSQVAAIAGLRGMFRQSGFLVGVSVTTAVLERSSDPGLTQAHAYQIFALLIVALIPLVFVVPDHRGRW